MLTKISIELPYTGNSVEILQHMSLLWRNKEKKISTFVPKFHIMGCHIRQVLELKICL